ncbi:MAG: NUDIX domain-containing protein [Gammaproteobacteria bacterium]|nr:NUDIX domain-containing protein [Gammaproteobacteria bacterium]
MNAHRHPTQRRNRRRRLSAGAIIVRRSENGLLFLLLRAFRHWDFPKGMVEEGETPLEGACREVEEETGIDQLDFRWGEEFYESPPYNRGKVARYYLAETAQADVELKPNPETGRTEHVEWDWVSFEQAWHLTSPRVQKALEWAARILDLDAEGQPQSD